MAAQSKAGRREGDPHEGEPGTLNAVQWATVRYGTRAAAPLVIAAARGLRRSPRSVPSGAPRATGAPPGSQFESISQSAAWLAG